ncbi:hypothetical protein ABZ760_18615 [Streptomyces sp. NPDC006658]|uniref:hypothetical protein n=1 Tax=Streptomyces sp. NPDC006658 TaxID=3156900 RepID=UPI0033E9D056
MSANHRRLIAVAFCLLISAFIGVVWGVVMRVLGDPVIDCIKSGGGSFGTSAMLGTAAILLFPFKDDVSGGIARQAPPTTDRAGTPGA